MKPITILIIFLSGLVFQSYGQKYKNGGVSIINAKGENWETPYHKIQLGINLPASMTSRQNTWYWEKRDSFNTGKLAYPSLSLQYAWSSNVNTEFIIHSDYEQIRYYNPSQSKQSEHSYHFASLLLGVNYKWWNNKDLVLYSGLMLGGVYGIYDVQKEDIEDLSINTVRDNLFLPTAQLTVLGVNYGKKFGVFGEIGLGTRGFFTAGVYLRF
ncbi:MAG TPA: hypothetical protein VLZ83_10665 [Edaphocola sp.]|nr:hypothetical protein [Edaphocola sp.]